MYNLTNITDAADPALMVAAVNDGVGGTLFGGFTIALWFIIMFSLRRGTWPVIDTVISASFTCFVISAILATAKFVDIIYPLTYLALTAFSGLWIYLTSR